MTAMSLRTPNGAVPFDLDGTVFTLFFSVDSLCCLEDSLNMSSDEIGKKLEDKPRLKFLRALFHAGLSERHPDITVRQAGEVFQVLTQNIGPGAVGELIGTAWGKAFIGPEADQTTAVPPNAAQEAA